MAELSPLPDKAAIARRFQAAWPHYREEAAAQARIQAHLLALLAAHGRRDFASILEIGCGNGGFTRLLADHCPGAHWTLNDLCDTRADFDFLPQACFVCGDAESADLGHGHDLLAAASAVQWFARPQDWPERAAAALAHCGLLLFNTFDPGNLTEVRRCSGSGLHYPGIGDWLQWLAPHFRIHHIGSETVRLALDDPMAVLHHLKRTGVTATGHGQTWSKGRLAEFCRRYRALYGTPTGKVTLTYTPLYVLAEKKAA